MPVGENVREGMLTRIDPSQRVMSAQLSSCLVKKKAKDNRKAGLLLRASLRGTLQTKRPRSLNLGVLAIYRASNLGVGCRDS